MFKIKLATLLALILMIFSFNSALAFGENCCNDSQCNGATCANAPANCPGDGMGTCTGGGTNCGVGIGSSCPNGYQCVSGNCCLNSLVVNGVCTNPTPATPGPGTGSSCPAECRQSACGQGYESASGCGTCNSNQVCCRSTRADCGVSDTGTPTPPGCYQDCIENYDPCRRGDNCPGTTGSFCGQTANNPKVDKYECTWYTCTMICPTNPPATPVITPSPAPSCTITGPVITSITRNSETSATINWTLGTGGANNTNGIKQMLFISQDVNQVQNDCGLASSPGCVVNLQNLPANQTSYATGNIFAPGVLYYVKVVNYNSATCRLSSNLNGNTTPVTFISSCTLSPTTLNLQIGETGIVTSSVSTNSRIARVEFVSSNSSVTTVTSPDTTSPYTTTVTAVGVGNAKLKSNVFLDDGTIACTNDTSGNGSGGGNDGNTDVTVTDILSSWWQIQDSDLTSNGALESSVPTGSDFSLDGDGGSPGIPTYTTTTDLTASNVSSTGWITQNENKSNPVLDFNYFENQIPDDVVFNTISSSNISGSTFTSGGTQSYGYYWYMYDGSTSGLDLTINSDCNVGDRKVILVVKSADLNIQGDVNLNNGTGFFMSIVDDSINVDATVGGGGSPNLEGFYICDKSFHSGLGTNQLWVRGAVVAYEGIYFERDLGLQNITTPSELLEYAPDQVISFPAKLATRKLSWKEVAP